MNDSRIYHPYLKGMKINREQRRHHRKFSGAGFTTAFGINL